MRALPLLVLLVSLAAEEPAPPGLREGVRDPRVLWLNAGVGAAVLAYGALAWDYGSADLYARSEGWFSGRTRYGGADKLGHAYTAYALGSRRCKARTTGSDNSDPNENEPWKPTTEPSRTSSTQR